MLPLTLPRPKKFIGSGRFPQVALVGLGGSGPLDPPAQRRPCGLCCVPVCPWLSEFSMVSLQHVRNISSLFLQQPLMPIYFFYIVLFSQSQPVGIWLTDTAVYLSSSAPFSSQADVSLFWKTIQEQKQKQQLIVMQTFIFFN